MRRSHTGQTISVEGPLTGSFDALVQRTVATNPKLRKIMRRDAMECMRAGASTTGQFVLATYLDEHPVAVREAAAMKS